MNCCYCVWIIQRNFSSPIFFSVGIKRENLGLNKIFQIKQRTKRWVLSTLQIETWLRQYNYINAASPFRPKKKWVKKRREKETPQHQEIHLLLYPILKFDYKYSCSFNLPVISSFFTFFAFEICGYGWCFFSSWQQCSVGAILRWFLLQQYYSLYIMVKLHTK